MDHAVQDQLPSSSTFSTQYSGRHAVVNNMTIPFEKIVTSPVFTFLTGRERTSIIVHSSLIAHHSSALNNLMNGPMLEAKTGLAELPDIDTATFIHFSQWLYSGIWSLDYADGVSHIRLRGTSSGKLVPWDYMLSSQEKKVKMRMLKLKGEWSTRVTEDMVEESLSALFTDPFAIRSSPVRERESIRKRECWNTFIGHTNSGVDPPPRTNPDKILVDWREVLLSHARLYCFADKYGISLLKDTCVNAVEAALIDFECQLDQVEILVDLLSFVIQNTHPAGVNNDRDLRTVVLRYAAIVYEVLSENGEFQTLLQTDHDLCLELLDLLRKRVD